MLVGILTNRDIRFVEPADYEQPVSQFMTPQPLVTAPVGISLEDAKRLLQKHRIEKLPLVDEQGVLKGLITVKDIQKARDFPNAAKDAQGRLLVGAAVGVGADLEERVELLVEGGVDVVVVDTAHGHSAGVVRAIQRIHQHWPDLPVIAGNVVTAEGTEALIEAGADAVKVGVGAGSICTTRVISGAGMPQMTAIFDCAQAARKLGVPIIADGGIKYSGDIVKAHRRRGRCGHAGQPAGRAGRIAGRGGAVRRPALQRIPRHGQPGRDAGLWPRPLRQRRRAAASGKLVPEGIEGRVPYKGSLHDYVYQLVGGLRSGMGYAGAATLEDLRTKATPGAHHQRRADREPPARCDHHQGSAELPGESVNACR